MSKAQNGSLGGLLMGALLALASVLPDALPVAQAATVTTLSPQGTVAKVRQVRVSFSDAMVRFGDPRLPAPATVSCKSDQPLTGTGRWMDDKTWVHDFSKDVPAGTRCDVALTPGLKALSGDAVTGTLRYAFSTGGPAVVRAWPEEGRYTDIEEEQVFALLLNGPATTASVEKHAHCEASGIVEQVPVRVVDGQTRTDILQTLNLTARQDRVVMLRCARPIPPESTVNLVWGKGIATAGGVANVERMVLDYRVRPAFSASFSCERVNSRAGCLPIRPLRLAFSSPVPRQLAERIVLRSPDGNRKPVLESDDDNAPQERLFSSVVSGVKRWFLVVTGQGSKAGIDPADSAVSAVVFQQPLPDNAELSIELPAGFKDDAGRALSNASAFPLKTRTSDAPPLLKFPRATFGVIELNADPTLPVTVRHVEGKLAMKGLQVGKTSMRDLRLSDDADIIEWLARVKQYDERRLPREQVQQQLGIRLPREKPVDPEDDADLVHTRTVSLLNRERQAKALQLPAVQQTDPHPFEVIGIPMPTPGFHVVEVASPRLGQALLEKQAPMYVRTSVLVTNLGVHFKWGAANSLVWVTTLDKARPVADAQIQVSDCQGQTVWKGRTDKRGLARIDKPLPSLGWDYCRDDALDREEGYFVSARKTDDKGRADMAFVWSSWNQGIEAWRFPFASSDMDQTEPLRFHTVMDRTLLRAGQTVSMRHHARAELLQGMRLLRADELPTGLRIVHEGSDQKFELPLAWQQQRHADTTFALPEDAKLGRYRVEMITPRGDVETGSFRVEAFRLPVLSGRIMGPKGALVQPRDVPLSLQVNYTNGGGAARLPVRVSAQFNEVDVDAALRTSRFPGYTFRQPRRSDDGGDDAYRYDTYVDEDDEASAIHTQDGSARLVADKLAVTLDAKGAGQVTLSKLPDVTEPRELRVQATYADPNGEVQTLGQTLPVWPSGVVLGMRTDSWVSVKQKAATQVMVLDTSGNPQAGVKVSVHAVRHSTQSIRKRLVGGFYAYDNQRQQEDLGEVCQGTSDARGLVWCETRLEQAGEMELVASARDSAGHEARAAASVWVTRQGELWFGGDNQDRMDVIPERRSYEAGQVARFQVRSPFRHATALVSVERNGIIETFTTELHGQDPTIEVPIRAEWAPNVYVSVLAVRGRVLEVPWYSFFTWGWKAPTEWWQAWRESSQQYQEPTAMVDLSRPAFKYGVAEIEVGMAPHTLKVEVLPDRSSYPIRATSQVKLRVRMPDGSPAPAGTEVSLAAVDEALLQLKGNDSWDLLGAMVRPRGYGVETATAQMQIIGKRHYGRKAVPTGGDGGGGAFAARELFDTLLLWRGAVVLDARGEAVVQVPLNDSLTAFRIVAVADVVKGSRADLFGTGQATITATQDLQILSGVPPLVREGDVYRAMFTLRNATAQPMTVALQGSTAVPGAEAAGASTLPAQRVLVPANTAAEVGWDVTVPYGAKQLQWDVSAQTVGGASSTQDRMKFTQQVAEAQPVTVQQATLVQLDKPLLMPVAVPARALPAGAATPGAWRGGIEVSLKPSLADGLDGVRDYFRRYPWSCLEQKTSIAIGTRDTAYWQSIARQIPLYLDEDGLANYFPPSAGDAHGGSDSLTAYLLAITDEASKLGHDFHIPDETRERMVRGLSDFVEGRIQRDFWAPSFLKNGDLDVRKLAALEALSRLGRARPAMVDSIQVLPNQWPTAAVIDWLMVLDRMKDMPDRARRTQEAEQILRGRLNVQGTRLGFSTERDDNWWWLMANGDVNSVRMLLSVLDKPQWQTDVPRLVTGALQRQQRGRWSTTVANAWGSVVVEAFSRRFEKDPVAGTTRAMQGDVTQALNWSAQPGGATLALPWPASKGEVRVVHEGSGKPWVTFTSKAAVPLQAPFSSGYRIAKTVTPLEQKLKGTYSRGDVLRIRLDIDVQADATWVVVNDPVPGGATILGSGLGRDSVMDTASEQTDDRGWLAYQERTFEAFRAYYRYLPKGSFHVEYTVRLNNPGTFGMPATRVEAMYAPEMFGEWPNASVVVKP